jgi:hypothetical protein
MSGTTSTSDRVANFGTAADTADNPATSTPGNSVLQAARRLERLTKSVESSLAEQFRQLDELLAHTPNHGADESREAARSEFAQKRSAWERERSEEYVKIERERNQLGDAWARVEAEQRRLMAEEALLKAQANAAPERGSGRARETAETPNAPGTAEAEAAQAEAKAARDNAARQTVLVEYEQLKSDVQKHARRLRRAR